MWSSTILLAFGTLTLLIVSPVVLADDVVVLTQDNFEKEVGQDRSALVDFYALWCGHCKKLAPEYEKLAASFKKKKSILIGKVDCDDYNSLCNEYGVDWYPTLQWFPKNSLKHRKYEGARNAEALIAFINHEEGTNMKAISVSSRVVILTPENFDEIVRTPFRKVLFMYEVSGYPTLKNFPESSKSGEIYAGGRELDDLVAYINDKCGTNRYGNGHVTSQAGMIEILNDLVKALVTSDNDDRKEAFYSQMKEEVYTLKGRAARYGKIYLKVAGNYMDKGAKYVKNEIQRLGRILEKSVSPAKADEFVLKRTIVAIFTSS